MAVDASLQKGHDGVMAKLRWKLASASILALTVMVAGAAAGFYAVSGQTTDTVPLCVMTFNLRYASPKPPNSWPERRPVMRDCIRQVAPDLIGTQEGLYGQLKDIASDLPDYEWIGLGRDGGSRGEFMAVFYRRERFEPLAFDHFWLSDTPERIGSSTWGNSNRRMVTWVHFRERQTGREFFFWNTHLDHEVELARQNAAALIMERTRQLKTDLPVLLVGDFNAAAGSSKAYEILVNKDGFADTWLLARTCVNEKYNTFHGFNTPVAGAVRIDWILARGAVTVDKTEIITCSAKGQSPSDHFPVAAWLHLPAGK
jgi:endonuclease/exonuclease/phosphatase family metal-dependent hydrolase